MVQVVNGTRAMVTVTAKGQPKEEECGNKASGSRCPRHIFQIKFIVGREDHLPLQEGDTIKTAVNTNRKVM